MEDGSPQQESVDPLAKRLDFGVEQSALTREQHGTRYISLPNMRLAVVFEKFWLAILHIENKLVEFRSSKHPTLLESGQCLLFALAMRHRRNGKELLVIARVSRVELLLVDTARKRYPREAEHCRLPALAAKWGVTFVRCIVLDSHSIRIADEIVNLSRGCLGVIHPGDAWVSCTQASPFPGMLGCHALSTVFCSICFVQKRMNSLIRHRRTVAALQHRRTVAASHCRSTLSMKSF